MGRELMINLEVIYKINPLIFTKEVNKIQNLLGCKKSRIRMFNYLLKSKEEEWWIDIKLNSITILILKDDMSTKSRIEEMMEVYLNTKSIGVAYNKDAEKYINILKKNEKLVII
ncbi:hypothetical protein PBV87_21380 [Niameybacter massiliensis]|uniref:Uncharacterized protein n=1 Tax=Holtiella tumoricola TaxID=3018743 RepID=A0AA42J364_9FIRM|nr:hypothetical protein [Holtiella tumoricola]MDA3734030.1 hypothetical protein [Holtiella tumoricola]